MAIQHKDIKITVLVLSTTSEVHAHWPQDIESTQVGTNMRLQNAKELELLPGKS